MFFSDILFYFQESFVSVQGTVFPVEDFKNSVIVLFKGFEKNVFKDVIAGGIHTGDQVFQDRNKSEPHDRAIEINGGIIPVNPVTHFMADIVDGFFIPVNVIVQFMNILVAVHTELCRKLLVADEARIFDDSVVLFFGDLLDKLI